jgi:hypothetical protein
LWLIKIWFSASTFVVKIATFAKPETVIEYCEMYFLCEVICEVAAQKEWPQTF